MQLYRTDFAQVGTTNRGCMRVIPHDKKTKATDKVVVGGQNGSVICVARKNNDTQIVYKTLPGAPVTSVCLGGALGTLQDKVFVCADTHVSGINKKGKPFFGMDSSIAGPARRMFIHGVDLLLTSQKSYMHHHDSADANYVLCDEDIHDVVGLFGNGGAWADRPFTAVLACDDATIKVVEASSIAYSVQLSDIPFTLYLFMGDGGFTNQRVLYGTRGGTLGLVEVPEKKGTIVWERQTTTHSAITAITCYPFTGGERPDVLVGKEDGVIEIYTVDEEDRLTLAATFNSEETVTGISCGRVSQETQDEIIACTYTGWLFSLCTTPLGGTGSLHTSSNVNVKVQQLRTEIEELESKVSEERQRYNEMTLKDGTNAAYVPQFQIHDSFEFSPAYGAYTLTIELVLPIDYLIVQSALPVKLVEVEKNSSVVCLIARGEHNPWNLLASYRCQAKTNRIELRVKVNEGISGMLNVYVIPNIHPKAARVRPFEIKPLSAHVRVHQIDANRPMNILSFTGSFSMAEAHAWLVFLLPGVASKCPPTDTVVLNYQSAINGGTQLQAQYSRGSAVFRSDSMSTIAVIRDKIGQETTHRQLRVHIQCDLSEPSIEHCLKLLHPRMTYLLGLQQRKMIATALRELEVNSDDVTFLSEDNRRILKDHDEIYRAAERESLDDSGILSIYESLLTDRSRLQGRPNRMHVAELDRILRNHYTLDNLVRFFNTTSEEASLR